MRGVLALSACLAFACRDPDPVDTAVPLKCDRDGDTYASAACEGGDDCDDDDDAVHPGAAEICNGKDDDCDGNQPAVPSWYADADGDGYGDPLNGVASCDPPSGYVATASDCNDADPNVSPEDPERCDNAIDDDCDGTAVAGEDADGDGFFADTCLGGDDCDDDAPEINVGAVDECGDGIDSDCSGRDRSCGYEGEYDLAEASATLRSDLDSYDAGRLVEAGDVTGDGNDDVFVATLYGGGGYGGGYIVPGPVPGDGTLEENGFRIDSSNATYGASRSIGLGDANRDGIEDVSFGAPYASDNGQYIVFGPVTGDMELEHDADAWLTGRSGTYCGHGSDLGDLDDDGYEDAVIGAYWDNTGGRSSGTLFVEFGPLSGHVDLESDADVEIAGANQDEYAGRMVHAGEDINGDGVGDFAANAIGASTGGPQAGVVYVVYGPAAIDSLDDADGSLVGAEAGAIAGTAFTVADFDGDGLADVASFAYIGGGSVAITPGPASGEIDLATAETIIEATSMDQQLGSGLGSGDVDLDGVDELLIGAPGDSECGENWCGAAFLVFSPPTGTWEITDVARASFRGVRQSDQSGQGVAIGDLDGDGSGELIIGAPGMRRGGGVHVESLSF